MIRSIARVEKFASQSTITRISKRVERFAYAPKLPGSLGFRDTPAPAIIGKGQGALVDDSPSPQCVWLPALAVEAPEPPHVTEKEAPVTIGADAGYYATRLRGASNEEAKRVLHFAPRVAFRNQTVSAGNSSHRRQLRLFNRPSDLETIAKVARTLLIHKQMKNKKLNKTTSTIAALLSVAISVPLAASAAGQGSKTLQNLQTAYNGESNAHAKYLEFAKQAEKEGYGKIGSLFRAAAAAEQIHRTCEANVIKEMGASPEAKIKLPPIKLTKQNLEESANKGEAYERDTMYPSFIRQAQKDRSQAAAQCFEWARAAEAEHFKLFEDATNNLAQMRGGPEAYYVCSEGGYTMAKLDAAKCPGGKYAEVR